MGARSFECWICTESPRHAQRAELLSGTLQRALYLCSPVSIDAVCFCWVVLAEFEQDKLFLEARIGPHLFPSCFDNSKTGGPCRYSKNSPTSSDVLQGFRRAHAASPHHCKWGEVSIRDGGREVFH